MSGRLSMCTICPGENEQIDAVIKIGRERRSVIYGTVIDENRDPVADAVVKLLQVCDNGRIIPLTHTFTDKYGQFLLGPLCPNQKYMLKIYKDNITIRYDPIDAECSDGDCIGNKCKRHDSGCK
ncbi:carboxypeptidase-like regulatory domain-containing protein [Clostridium saccharobutylicum]|uniref:Carboxypeptidase regulatory-like domain-containing protein n=1 Tax=Clostridium saccharobutylicum DSM 13864 TaxID=1345695 RepID=U5ML36_CLOSA|nr:carboxypeptidase-like regulatory domain-containing protein [Clostridium saccharobutylicum]AGX41499.1 hypothetical protein CLSA_c04760 [Clostridium saccharobutylicum DSM 13864]AQR88779.1 hypothetical protein CLOSC_04640 [Clostridium saccharobutylicum]AQR98677.1 hypothetical protein CSACC_04700 [Clostridium saccharobutylicum]AQS08401.1 hypothetical protein CLOBY_05000 [Clostridium saccharobutylicum]AQS12667.1 hypothetical protein CLOSACC_04700 [Clostridium saccharobutylicum]